MNNPEVRHSPQTEEQHERAFQHRSSSLKHQADLLIRIENISRSYHTAKREFNALKNINLEICKGEYIAVTGKSGSGKSTLLNMLTGIDHPDQGNIMINGVEIHKLNETQLAKWRGKNIGIVFQFFQLIPTLSILENILLAMDFGGCISPEKRSRRAETLLRQMGIFQHKDKMPSALSGGEQQRAAIARALANDPPILVADEPTGNLDSQTGNAIQKIFQNLVKDGKTVIVVTHEKTEGQAFSRIFSLKDGEIDEIQKGV